MNTFGDIVGLNSGEEEAIVTFNEVGKRGGPMGKYHGLAVFHDRYSTVPELGKSYYCYLSRDPKSNVYKAMIKTEVTLEGIINLNPGLKKELVDTIMKEYPEAFRSEISAARIKDYENEVKEKYKAENAALRAKVEHLEGELSKLSDLGRKELELVKAEQDAGIDDNLLHDERLEDGEYTVRIDRRKTKALFFRCDGGEYYCTSGYIDISPFLKRNDLKKVVCKHCEELDGALVSF